MSLLQTVMPEDHTTLGSLGSSISIIEWRLGRTSHWQASIVPLLTIPKPYRLPWLSQTRLTLLMYGSSELG